MQDFQFLNNESVCCYCYAKNVIYSILSSANSLPVCLPVYPRIKLERLKINPRTHIYLESVSPVECHEHVYMATPFHYKKAKNGTFARKWNETSQYVMKQTKKCMCPHCMSTLRLPKIWHRVDVIAILKPNKPNYDAKYYCPILLLFVPLKLLKCLLLTQLEPVIDLQLPLQQTGFPMVIPPLTKSLS